MSTTGEGANTPTEPNDQNRGRSHRTGGAGRGHQGRGSHGGRGRGRDQRGRNRHTPRFRGATTEIEEYTFGIHEGYTGAKKYTDNVKQLKIYAFGHCNTDMGALFGKNPETPTIEKPKPLDDKQKTDETEVELYKLALREYVEQSRKQRQDIRKMYSVVLGQCTDAMLNKIRAIDDYEEFNDKADCARLLSEIRKITYLTDEKEDPFMSAATTSSKLYRIVQERETVTDYYDTWSNMVEVVKQKGGGFVNDELVKTVLKDSGTLLGANIVTKLDEGTHLDENEHKRYIRARTKAEEKFLASLFIKGLSGQKYGKLKDELSNQCSWGNNNYPTDITAAYEMALNYRDTDRNRRDRNRNGHGIDGLSFLNQGGANQQAVAGTDGRTWYSTICYNCGQPGHRAAVCPEAGGSTTGGNGGGGNSNSDNQQEQSGVSHFMKQESDTDVTEISTDTEANTDTGEEGEYGVTFSQMVKRQKGIVNQAWILLDSQSTHSIFSNGSLLTNIRHCGHTGLTMYSNGGSQHTVMIGDYEPLGLTVWYNEHSLANILSMKDTRRVARVTMDTMIVPAMAAQKYGESDLIIVFEECEIGLYRHDTASVQNLKINDEQGGFNFINTVDGNKEGFTQRQIERANQALALYRIIGRPSERRYYTILAENHIMNCPITVEDARRAFHIYGPDVATLRGKMTRRTPQAIKDYVPFELPADLLKEFRRINLATDIFFVQGRTHQHTISRRIKFRTVERIKNQTKAELLRSLRKVITLYTNRGFTIQQIMADNQYECLRDDLLPIMLTVVGAGEHVGDIERSIRTIKEGARTTTQGLPFKRYPGVLVDAIIQKSVSDRNNFPEENGVSKQMSPRTIITGLPKVDYQDCKLELGQYCEVYTHPDPTNRQHTRSVGCIALLPSNNNGGYTFMSLLTGERLHSYIWRALPMSRDVIRMVDRLGKKENQPLINKGGLMFEWAPGDPIFDDEDDVDAFDDDYESDDYSTVDDHDLNDDDYDMTDDDPNAPQDLPDDAADQRSVNNQEANPDAEEELNPEEEDAEEELNPPEEEEDNQEADAEDAAAHNEITDTEDSENEVEEDANSDNDEEINNDKNVEDTSEEENEENEEENEKDNEEEDSEAQRSVPSNEDEEYSEAQRSAPPIEAQRSEPLNRNRTSNATQRSGTTGNTRSKRLTKRHNYKEANRRGFNFLNLTDPTRVDRVKMAKHITGIVLTQLDPEDQQKKSYYWKKGIKVMGEDAIKAIVAEAQQLDDKGAFEPLKAETLDRKQKSGALESITMVTKKRCGKVKGRTCADGRKQRDYVTKAESSSPTISLEGLMTIILTAAHEDRQVLVADIAGAYLNADMDDFVTMKFKDEMVDYMVAANPERYAPYVTYEEGRKVLYVRLLKALYGCIQSALLWYRMLTGKLMQLGYKINKYDQCVANKQIDGKQCTIGYYVDDLIATQKNQMVLKELKEQLEEEYGEMSATFGDTQTYLGMDISFNRKDKTATISMKGYLQDAVEKFEAYEELGKKPANTPAKRDLFEVTEGAEKLEEKRRALFHSITALLLYVSKRARPDISTTIAFLCTRPAVADVDDWRKLRRLLQYIKTTLDLKLVIGADSMTAFKTFIDVAYGVHMDMKSHTGGAMTFGQGVITSKSSKQKLNVKSSTEGEVVGMSDYVAFPIWFKYFLEEQGYKVEENIVYQDNQSAMKIEKNGIRSCGQKSRHINSRYFFIKDRVETNEIRIEYCQTEKMLADFFTKPLQGELFRRFRDVIMGHKHIDTLLQMFIAKTSSKERVGANGETEKARTNSGRNDDVARRGKQMERSYAEVVRGNETE